MNSLLERGLLEEMACGSNFAYLLANNNDFLPIEYKVLQGQSTDCFIKCVKMLYNGKVQLFYMLHNYKPLTAVLPTLSPEGFVTVVTNLLKNVLAVKSNGFLACHNIDISFEKVYVDPNTLKVGLVYIPISTHVYYDYSAFENELRSRLIRVINRYPALTSNKTAQLSANLSNGIVTLEEVLTALRGGRITPTPVEPPVSGPARTLRIIAMNAPSPTELVVSKTPYVIGKKESEVDGLVSFNKAISRKHCRIDKTKDGYTITDLDTPNHTYVNRVKLQPNVPIPIRDNDVVRLANSDFQVVIR